ncbi:pentapeptide repeat-containing protein [Cognatishimia sp. 1_MG-2023]|uniref:pentapeptide repeat-containing protein n=1 Tax=Cognatishimia sp. 1_MG-2023 TaxID=3062642 RepID=UPI0034A39D67
MTLYGEQEGDEIDWDLHDRNMRVWNTWFGITSGTSNEEKLSKAGIIFKRHTKSIRELTVMFKEAFSKAWGERNGTLPEPSIPHRDAEISLSSIEFSNELFLDGFTFRKTVDLSNSLFHKGLSAKNSGFTKATLLNNTRIKQSINVNSAAFLNYFDISGCNIEGSFTLKSAQCFRGFNFSNSFLGKQFRAKNLYVGEEFDAFDSTFEGQVDLQDAQVLGQFKLSHSTINGHAYFNRANFSSATEFVWTHFNNEANFAGTTFKNRAIFRKTIFKGSANFPSCEFQGNTDFAESVFAATGDKQMPAIRFTDAHFAKPTSFRNARFLNSYPEFTNTDLHPVTDFSVDTKTEKFWPAGITEPRKEARETCGIIRNLLAKKGLHEDQHFFFRKEMQFAKASVNKREAFTYWAYGALSDFGDSIQRPVVCLCVVWILGLLIFGGFFLQTPLFIEACFEGQNRWPNEALRPYGTGAALSLSNLFPPFGFNRTFFGNKFMGCLPIPLKFFSGLQTIVSLPFLFFLGLGLRQRFRLR